MAHEISRYFPTDFSSRISAVLWPTTFCSCNHRAAAMFFRKRPSIPSTALPTHKSSDCLPHRLLSWSRDVSPCIFNFAHARRELMRHLYSQSTTMSSKTTTNVANTRLVGIPCSALLFARTANVYLVALLLCYQRADTSLSVQLVTNKRERKPMSNNPTICNVWTSRVFGAQLSMHRW